MPVSLVAGGSGLNVVIVANQSSSNSCELANYYRLKRQVPPENVLRIAWSGTNVEWTESNFNSFLLNPLLSFLAANNLSNQIHYVVLSMDIPYRVTGSKSNSTTSALFYGFKTGAKDLTNSYAASEARFPDAKPAVSPGYSFLAMMLTAGSLEQAKHLVDQGVASDGSFPTSTAWLAKSSDTMRNIRYRYFDNALFNTRMATAYFLARTNLDSPLGLTNLLGYQTGLATFALSSNAFQPGAMADSFSSFGGQIFESSGQTSLLAFIHAGAAASYGTIIEPQPIVKKFPDPQVYFYQSRGYSIAESYYQGIEFPLEGLLVGEPLAAPFQRQLSGGWVGLENNDPVQGTTNLSLSFRTAGSGRCVDAIALFVDGKYQQTLTNLAPQSGNRLAVRLNGYEVAYQVPTNATLNTIASEFASLLNDPVHTNVTKVTARAHGDRIELQSFAPSLPAGTFEFVDHYATSNAPRSYLAVSDQTWIQPSLAGLGWNSNGSFRLQFGSTLGTPGTVYASSNLNQWQPIYTNLSGGLTEFVDADAPFYPKRFYRLAIPAQSLPPELTQLGMNAAGEFVVSVAGLVGRPYLLQASSDLWTWSDLLTNQLGGAFQFADAQAQTHAQRFYRTRSASPSDYSQVAVVGQTPAGDNILRVQESRPGDTVIWSSTNSVDWSPIYRHAGQSVVSTEVTSETGSAAFLGTTLRSARAEFLTTTAYGIRKCSINTNSSLQANDFISLLVTKTNGSLVTVAVTNQTALTTLKPFVQLFVNAVNSRAELTTNDGLTAEDLVDGNFGAMDFNLHARSAGREPAVIQVAFNVSTNLTLYSTSTVALDANIADLQPRNHLFVSAGLPAVSLTFPLATAGLADGYHELSAVAYEGTSVHSQTRSTVTVVVSNTPLQAQLTVPSQTNVLTVTNVFYISVVANTNTVSEILLYSTGGFLTGATNQSAVIFPVDGRQLGAGEHPFYAVVTTTNGLRFRTQTRNVTLVRP